MFILYIFFVQAEDCIRHTSVTGVQTCALPIYILFATRGNPTLPIPRSEQMGQDGAKALYEYLKKYNGIAISHTSATSMGRSEERRVGKEGGGETDWCTRSRVEAE